jgi:ADP-ribosylglycohydrolase
MSPRERGSREAKGPTLFGVGEGLPDSHKIGDRGSRAENSALWAAYGDALGFISELTDAEGLKRRTRGAPLTRPVAWERRIGGRQGVNVSLPEGCYSDDTQLRLSTGRAIGPDGFDVEAFSKVELTVWPSYALGGGKGTKAAASSLGKDQIAWYANSFPGWTNSGGNGAAMRIQPHVWAARDLTDPASYVPDVVRNSICTHGSPTGILGAVLHAIVVAEAICSRDIPGPADVLHHVAVANRVPELMAADPEVGELWVRIWEREASRTFVDAWQLAIEEAEAAVKETAGATGDRQSRYHEILERLGLFHPERRGSGLLTAVAAVGLLWAEPRPKEAMTLAANAVGSDTDTIATMAGAIVGAAVNEPPEDPVLDSKLIRGEAHRLARIGDGEPAPGHRYPDLLHWEVPRTQADALVEGDDGLVVCGLGDASALPIDPIHASRGDFLWQWVELSFGQTILIKRRRSLTKVRHIHERVRETVTDPITSSGNDMTLLQSQEVETRIDGKSPNPSDGLLEHPPPAAGIDRGVELQAVLRWLQQQGIEHNDAVGYAVRRVARDGTPDQLALLVGTLREELRR